MRMSGIPNGSIVVGVDGSEHSDRAVDWAARQAELEGRTLVVVHSCERIPLRDTAWLDVQGIEHSELVRALKRAGESVLADAQERARNVSPDVDVRTELVEADPREALVDASESAHLVVLGSRGHGPLRSMVLGSVSASVARHAHCPVVVCRAHADHAATGGLLVGADGTASSLPVLEFAFQQASLRGLPLTVMHCFWDVIAATSGAGPVQRDSVDGLEDLRLLLAESVAGLGEKFPDVEVDLQLARGLVDECLTAHAPDANLLIVGRAEASGWSRFLHASCALAVLERARTTVIVVPEPHEEGKPS